MITRINNWLNSSEKLLFTNRDGYFYLPYLSNCPEIMIESMKKILVNKQVVSETTPDSNNIFTDGDLYYLHLEDGLWVIITEMAFKKNVTTHALFDSEASNYYSLSNFSYKNRYKNVETEGVLVQSTAWSLHKPGTEIKKYFNKGDEGLFINFAFSKDWFAQHIGVGSFAPDAEFIGWENLIPNADIQSNNILNMMKSRVLSKPVTMAIKALTLQIISSFFINGPSGHFKIGKKVNEADKRLIAKTEKLLINNLTSQFPGIEKLGQLLHTTPGKLRTTFKEVHNVSIYQYYQKQQMILALEMLREKPTSVKYIALTFGYQNPSKFTKAFKKHHNMLPSQVE